MTVVSYGRHQEFLLSKKSKNFAAIHDGLIIICYYMCCVCSKSAIFGEQQHAATLQAYSMTAASYGQSTAKLWHKCTASTKRLHLINNCQKTSKFYYSNECTPLVCEPHFKLRSMTIITVQATYQTT